jgi:hypothetical protein
MTRSCTRATPRCALLSARSDECRRLGDEVDRARIILLDPRIAIRRVLVLIDAVRRARRWIQNRKGGVQTADDRTEWSKALLIKVTIIRSVDEQLRRAGC